MVRFQDLFGHFFPPLPTAMKSAPVTLPWLACGQEFPPCDQSWDSNSPAPGLLCAGGDLTPATLAKAYRQGIFPWFSDGQPILWWSPTPRMVLKPLEFRLQPSLRKTLRQFAASPRCEIRIDSDFAQVIQACAGSARQGQSGTWIVPEMIDAYTAFHQAGFAHSVETWVDGELVGGLYFVAIGRAVFGESMFHRRRDASKIALAALVCLCLANDVAQIDCQQNTRHLASLGARAIDRTDFIQAVAVRCGAEGPDWRFESLYWQQLLGP